MVGSQLDSQFAPLRVGVVGCGGIARAHMNNLKDNPLAQGYAYMDIKSTMAEGFLSTYGGSYATSDFEQILDDPNIDIVVIASPDNLHVEQALQVLATDKHLFLEKPLATNVADALRVQEAAGKAKGKFMLDLKFRFSPALRAAREHVSKPVMVLAQAVGDPMPEGHWRHDPKLSSGVIYDLGPHLFDLIYWFANAEPTRIYAEGGAIQFPDKPLADNLITTFNFANGMRAVAMVGCAGQSGFASKWLLELFGGETNATVYAHAQELNLRKAGDDPAGTIVSTPADSSSGELKLAFQAFLQAIVDDTTPPVGIEDGVRVTRMLEAALESARTGQVINL